MEDVRVLVNHIGYEPQGYKNAVLQISSREEEGTEAYLSMNNQAQALEEFLGVDPKDISGTLLPLHITPVDECAENVDTDHYKVPLQSFGEISGWKGRRYYCFDFSHFTTAGEYSFEVKVGKTCFRSAPFKIEERLQAEECISDILFYLKGQRCSGRWDAADRRVPFYGGRVGTADVHGGWYDAAGDYSKYLSHLSYANYFNPQQIPLVVWALTVLGDSLAGSDIYRGSLLRERALEEARWGADFLMRMQDPEGYFYITVFDQWSKDTDKRMICSFKTQQGERLENYEAGFRKGSGMAIAALARLYNCLGEGDYPRVDYLKAAEKGFAHVNANNKEYVDNGRENIIDYYCRLAAAAELYGATKKEAYLEVARTDVARLKQLFDVSKGYWRVEAEVDRPYFHASDSGLPTAALIRYLELEPEESRRKEVRGFLQKVGRSILTVSEQGYNPFRLTRQYVQGVDGPVHPSFFIPHNNETGYWWQGENARLASTACALRLTAPLMEDEESRRRMRHWAAAQLPWILGLNPFDMCMLQGHGRNNPKYEQFYPNAPGGICNGITAGYLDEADIDFLPAAVEGQGDHRWRWSEQWLPHGAWFLLALAAGFN